MTPAPLPPDTTPEALTSQQVIDKMTALMQEQPDGRYLSAPETWNELLAWLRALAALPPPAPQAELARDLYRRIGTVISVAQRRSQPDADHLAMLATLRELETIALALGWPEPAASPALDHEALVTEWRERASHERNDTWCNTEDAPIWRSIHRERADVFDACAAQLEAALRAAPRAPAVTQKTAQDLGPHPDCPRCKGTGECSNAQFRCPCRWSTSPIRPPSSTSGAPR